VRIDATGTNTCPINHLRATRAGRPITAKSAPFFQRLDGSALRDTDVLHHMRLIVVATLPSVDPTWIATHSCRIGGASSYFQLGWPAAKIQQYGRWKVKSHKTFAGYVRLPDPRERRKAILALPASWHNHSLSANELSTRYGGVPVKTLLSIDWDSLERIIPEIP
jgi:hypothetical protein